MTDAELRGIGEPRIVVAHSLGVVVVLKYLAKERRGRGLASTSIISFSTGLAGSRFVNDSLRPRHRLYPTR